MKYFAKVFFALLVFAVTISSTFRVAFSAVPQLEELEKESLRYVVIEDFNAFRERTIALRNELFRRGVLSLNDYADRVYELTEGKTAEVRRKFLREALKVSPLNVKFWLYLSLSDLVTLRVFDFPSDFLNLVYGSLKNPVALVKTIFIGMGFSSLLLLFFTLFFSLSIFFKYAPNLVADLAGGKSFEKGRVFLYPLFVIVMIVLLFVLRTPLLVFFAVLVVFTPYMIHRELVTTIGTGVLIILLALAHKNLGGLTQVAVTNEGGEAIQVAYGVVPDPQTLKNIDPIAEFKDEILLRRLFFEKNYERAEKVARKLSREVDERYSLYEVLARFYAGKKKEALSLLKEMEKLYPGDRLVTFNLYQVSLSNFLFDVAHSLRTDALEGISRLRPYSLQSDEVEEGVLIPAEMPVTRVFTVLREKEMMDSKAPLSALWRTPYSETVRVYIILLAVALGLRVLTFNRYLHTACKVCGERQPWRVRFKKDDVCGLCSSRSHEFRGGARALEKAANIRLYRKATIARSLLLPGYTFLAMNSVTIYALWTGLFSFFLSLFVIFRFAFPGNLSSLYGKIHAYGLVISGVGCGAIYLFFNGLGAAVFRRLLKKHRVWGI